MKRALVLGILTALCACSLVITGCDSGNREVNTAPPADSEQTPPPAGEETGGMPHLDQPETVLAVKDAEAAYQKAKKSYEGAKTDAKAKEAYLEATLNLADANMYNPELPPRVKYRAALQYYREALKIDPENEKASAAKTTIEEIYKSMGKEVPGEEG